MLGFSDGATEIRRFSYRLETAYGDTMPIAYVGMIDLAREDIDHFPSLPWFTLPSPNATVVSMPDNILEGDNFYEQAHRDGAWFGIPPDLNKVCGHPVKQKKGATIDNICMTSEILSISEGGHLTMPKLLFIQNYIAWHAASAYIEGNSSWLEGGG